MGGCSSSPEALEPIPCANGRIDKGSRVKTQWTRDEGGNDQWYTATVVKIFDNGKASLRYDDGDRWTGRALFCYLLDPPPEAPMGQAVAPEGVVLQGMAVPEPVVAVALPEAPVVAVEPVAMPMATPVAPMGYPEAGGYPGQPPMAQAVPVKAP